MKGGRVATLALVLSVLAAHASIGEGESAITKLVNFTFHHSQGSALYTRSAITPYTNTVSL